MSSTEDEIKTGSIEGEVKGYLERNIDGKVSNYSTKALPARVFILICVGTSDDYQLFYPAPKRELGKILREKILDRNIQGIDELKEKFPTVNKHIEEHINSFNPRSINAGEKFKFNEIPFGWWGYVVGACVEDKLYFITDKYGSNGISGAGIIPCEAAKKQTGRQLKNVFVRVRDVWQESTETGQQPPLPKFSASLPPALKAHEHRRPHVLHGEFAYQWWLFKDNMQAQLARDKNLSPATLYKSKIGQKICGPGDFDEEVFGRAAKGKDAPVPDAGKADIVLFDETIKYFIGTAYIGLGACKLTSAIGDGSNADGKWQWEIQLIRRSGAEPEAVQEPTQAEEQKPAE